MYKNNNSAGATLTNIDIDPAITINERNFRSDLVGREVYFTSNPNSKHLASSASKYYTPNKKYLIVSEDLENLGVLLIINDIGGQGSISLVNNCNAGVLDLIVWQLVPVIKPTYLAATKSAYNIIVRGELKV